MGFTEVGNAEFGIESVFSGLYIEKVWDYSNKYWNDYIKFINDCKMSKVKFKDWDCKVELGQYANGRTAITLVSSRIHDEDPDMMVLEGEPIATATINVPKADISDNEVIIKDWSENKGILECLMKAFIVAEPHGIIHTPGADASLCKLLIK
mgnify:CR=1 FL=1|tara:strand:+ start:7935 stop:8390 length:456 start_codon:yes stop_codon:yes gene_type:complete